MTCPPHDWQAPAVGDDAVACGNCEVSIGIDRLILATQEEVDADAHLADLLNSPIDAHPAAQAVNDYIARHPAMRCHLYDVHHLITPQGGDTALTCEHCGLAIPFLRYDDEPAPTVQDDRTGRAREDFLTALNHAHAWAIHPLRDNYTRQQKRSPPPMWVVPKPVKKAKRR